MRQRSSSERGTVLVVTNIPTPYRIPLFNEIGRQLREKGMELFVAFGASGYARREWKVDMGECRFAWAVLDSRRIPCRDREKSSFTYGGLGRLVKKVKPRLVITSGFSPATVKLWLGSFAGGVTFIIWSGETKRAGSPGGGARRFMRRLLVRRASAFVVYGTRAAEYLRSLGAAEDKVFTGINTVDTEFFRSETEAARKERDGRDAAARLLYVGDLSPRKNVEKLLEVFFAMAARRDGVVLDIVGDGPARGSLERRVSSKGLGERVVFHGYRQKAEMPSFLARTDGFLFQTDFDIWGLVLVEAMAAGLPCVASVNAGATADLVRHGETGFRAEFGNVDETVRMIERLLDDEELRGKVGEAASRHVERHLTLEKSAAGFVTAVESVTGREAEGKSG